MTGCFAATSALVAASPAMADAPTDEQSFVEAINRTRVGVGLAPLRANVTLAEVARVWAEKMRAASVAVGTDDCLISHNPNLRTAVPLLWKKLGENVGCGDVGVDVLHAAFVNSPKHYANIVDPDFDSVGIGIVFQGDVMFVTEQFMDADEQAGSTAVPGALALAVPKTGTSKVLAASAVPSTRRRPTTTKRKRT